LPHAQPPSWRTNPCCLSMAAYSIHSQLTSIAEGRSSIRNPRTCHAVGTGTPPNMACGITCLTNFHEVPILNFFYFYSEDQGHGHSICRAAHTHLPVVVAGRVWWGGTVTRHPSILLCGNAGVRRALHETRRPRSWSWRRGCGPRRDSTAGLWGQVQVRLWRRSVGKARGHGEQEVVRKSFIRLQNTTARG
jgi:hypothetical protein